MMHPVPQPSWQVPPYGCLAISASTLCLIHCLVLPVLIAFLPAIAEWADLGEVFHIVMLALTVPLSGLTLFGGWRRHRVVLR